MDRVWLPMEVARTAESAQIWSTPDSSAHSRGNCLSNNDARRLAYSSRIPLIDLSRPDSLCVFTRDQKMNAIDEGRSRNKFRGVAEKHFAQFAGDEMLEY